MKKIKKIIKIAFFLFIGFLIFLTGQTVAETIKVEREIKKFMKKGVYQEHISAEGIIEYYKVSRETYHPDELIRTPFYNGNLETPGDEGDLFVTRQAPLPDMPGFYEFVSFYFGGHAGYVDDKNSIYETYGFYGPDENLIDVIINGGEDTYVDTSDNYWLDPNYRNEDHPYYNKFGSYYRKEWIGLRIKGIQEEEIKQVTQYMKHLAEIKAQYNHLYVLFTKNKYYCTDMMSRGFASIKDSEGDKKYNLNLDGVATTVNDLILSKDTYISYYVMTTKDNVKKVYYIE